MSFLRRVFSADYRQALAAEAEGDFLTAARYYALSGDTDKVARMHVAQARIEATLEGRMRSLANALGFTTPDDPYYFVVLRLLARASRTHAETIGVKTQLGQRALHEAATYFERAQSFQEAGDCWVLLDDPQRAAKSFASAGMVDRVEELFAEQAERQGRHRAEESLFKDYELLLSGGARKRARAALSGCIDAAEAKGEYRRLLAELDRRRPPAGGLRLKLGARELLLIGQFPFWIGRDRDCALRVRGPSVSRHHAQVRYDTATDCFSLVDGGGKNGTRLNDLVLGGEVTLLGTGTIGLGEDCRLRFATHDRAPRLLELTAASGLDGGLRALAGAGAMHLAELISDPLCVIVSFVDGWPTLAVDEATILGQSVRLKLDGAWIGGAMEPLLGDVLQLGETRIEVVD